MNTGSTISTLTYLKEKQYKIPQHLLSRINLHKLYATNSQSWPKWIFDQLNLPDDAKILELGAGPGTLWLDNLYRISRGWSITLSDFSDGMIEKAKNNLISADRNFPFKLSMPKTSLIPKIHLTA